MFRDIGRWFRQSLRPEATRQNSAEFRTHLNLLWLFQKGIGNPLRSFYSATLLGIESIALLISSKVILSHSSRIALRNSVPSRISPLFFSLCLIVLQIVSMGLRSGDSGGFDSHLMPNRLFACLHLLSLTPRVPWLLSLSFKSI
jgi:hypothetical protein